MENKCCLRYCKSEASGFAFPDQEKTENKTNGIEFISDPEFNPSVHSHIFYTLR